MDPANVPEKSEPEGAAGPPAKDQVIVDSQKLVALVFGVRRETVNAWAQQRDMPVIEVVEGERRRFLYDLVAIRRWYTAEFPARPAQRGRKGEQLALFDDLEGREKAARVRQAEAKAEREEIALRAEQERWLPRDIAVHELSAMFGQVRDRCLILGRRIAVRLGLRADQERIVQDEVDEALRDLSADDLHERCEEHRRRLEVGVEVGKGRGRKRGS